MGKPTGFLDYERKTGSYRPVEERIHDYRELYETAPEDELRKQGARCMDCGVPFCHSIGCPVINLIPEWNDAIYRGQWREAFDRLELTNNLPEVTGRVCPAPCETSCTLSINSSPVSIKQIELAIIERAFEEGWVTPRPPVHETGKRIAVIGSGPAGLSAAQQLRRAGHRVTVFEKSPKVGGLLRYGIPDFKLEKRVLDRRIEQMAAEGVEFEANVNVGEDISARYLRRKYEVVLLANGAGIPRDLPVPGRGLEGVHFAMEYLTLSNMHVDGLVSGEAVISAEGKHVLVIGGGDTGSDCVGTANRQGAKSVYQIEILPKPREWSEPFNPEWPEWPAILRTSTSHEEGCERDWAVSTHSFEGDRMVEKATFARVEWSKPEPGERPKMTELPGSSFTRDVDLVLLCMGFVHVEHGRLIEDLGVKVDQRGNIIVSESQMTTVDGVFAAGDSHNGASLVVRAINFGRNAAAGIDDYLIGR